MIELHIPAMLYRGLLDGDEKIKAMMKTRYGTQLLLTYATLQRDELYDSRWHGQGHIERVILLGGLIAMGEQFSERDTKLALFACSYHDIGRIDDSKDDDHGTRSAERLVSRGIIGMLQPVSEAEIAIVRAAIATHSMHDSSLEANMKKYGVAPEEEARCRRICWCLKDADNMDRVRLNDLDPRYLRLESSKNMVGTAWYILNEYISARRANLA